MSVRKQYFIRIGDAAPFEVTDVEWEAYRVNNQRCGGHMPTPHSFKSKDGRNEGWWVVKK